MNKKNYANVIGKARFNADIKSAALLFIRFIESNEYLFNRENKTRYALYSNGNVLFDEFCIQNSISSLIRKTFLTCYLESESLVAGSGVLAIYLLSHEILGLNHRLKVGDEARWCSSKLALSQIKKMLQPEVSNMLGTLVNNLGTKCTIEINKTEKTIPTLEISGGHVFSKIKIHPQFTEANYRSKESIILAVDGKIEGVGGLDRILNYSHENKASILLLSRGYSNDVISTLNVNRKRGTLEVIPAVVDNGISTVNIFSDIQACTGCTVVNDKNGLQISAISPHELTNLENVKINLNSLSFDSKVHMVDSVRRKIRQVKEKAALSFWNDDFKHEDINEVYGTRLRSLSSNSGTLWLPVDRGDLPVYKSQFYFLTSMMKNFAKSGALSLHTNSEKIPEYLPANVIDAAMQAATQTNKNICTIGACIEIQRS